MKKTLLATLAMAAAITAQAATQKTFTDREVLTIDSDTTWYGETYQSAIDVPANCRAVINIKKGKTLTVTGGNASGTQPGVAAIYVPTNATLYITGEGKLVARGGAAGNGASGSSGGSGNVYVSSDYGTAGSGGAGGAGGSGGSGSRDKNCMPNAFRGDGSSGGSGTSGSDGVGMG